jgi:DNA-binding NarL/FixJ family response regulator
MQADLSTKERFILQALADGEDYDNIAKAVSQTSTYASVKNMTYRAMHKLGADNRTHAVALAFRRGFIQ